MEVGGPQESSDGRDETMSAREMGAMVVDMQETRRQIEISLFLSFLKGKNQKGAAGK